MPDLSLDDLPGIDRWGLRRIEQTITAESVGGALVGFVGASLLSTPVAILAGIARHHVGYPWGHVVMVVAKLLAVYLALLVIAHWRTVDEST